MSGVPPALAAPPIDDSVTYLLCRIRSEYLEMPGLRLTPAQAARLWGMEQRQSEQLLDVLRSTGFLCMNPQGAYLRVAAG